MENIISFLNSIFPLSRGVQQYLSSCLLSKDFNKKQLLLKRGSIAKEIYFIESGFVRSFYMSREKEITAWFMKEGDVVISVESFFRQVASQESIQAIEDTTVVYISYSDLMYMYNHFPEFNFIGRVLTEKYYMLSEQRLHSIRMQQAGERYQYLLNHHPEIIQRAPATYIASYLGITLETLSRVKSK